MVKINIINGLPVVATMCLPLGRPNQPGSLMSELLKTELCQIITV